MSFMFKPLKYDDWSALNKPKLEKQYHESLILGNDRIVERILKHKPKYIHINGYVGADFKNLVELIKKTNNDYELINTELLTHSQEYINELTRHCLPEASVDDPVQLFGRLFEGQLEDLYNKDKVNQLVNKMKSDRKFIIYGHGSTLEELLTRDSLVIYLDISPKNTAIRAREEKYLNIGDDNARPFNLLMRRNYYVDFELVIKHRTKLIKEAKIDYYLDANDDDNYKMLPYETLIKVFETQAKSPFRCKPVYLEGIWGGEFIRKVRNIPTNISSNIAWIFEFIPMEVSIVFEINSTKFEVPFSTFLKYSGKEILGLKAYEVFDGYFPIRFNYDDTWHSDGNMSIQVHPNRKVMRTYYNELGSQDEAYYVIATGHNAKTYLGFNDYADTNEFINLSQISQDEGTNVEYKNYVHAEDSVPGKQFMIPSGTIHASGQNQFILELGSLTIGSYTYKIYDYNRKEKNGKQRPIHLEMAKKVLCFDRTESWIKNKLIIDPILVCESDHHKEYIIGQTDEMYYETARVELNTKGYYQGENNSQFTTITLVDGEKIKVYDLDNPERVYELGFLEIVTIPASIKHYKIENIGYQPVVIHKAYLRDDFESYR